MELEVKDSLLDRYRIRIVCLSRSADQALSLAAAESPVEKFHFENGKNETLMESSLVERASDL